MGTDIELIQYAYQGFAKQNFTIKFIYSPAAWVIRRWVWVNPTRGVGEILLTGKICGQKPMTIPCQAVKTEGLTTIGSLPSTSSIGTMVEALTNLVKVEDIV